MDKIIRRPKQARKYTSEDFNQVRDWYNNRSLAPIEDLLPQVGFIVPGIAAGFLMQTDTKCCILEPFISNPFAESLDRKDALDLIMGELILEAYRLGYNRIYGFSTRPSMIERAKQYGFEIVEKDSKTLCKELF